MTAFQDSGDQRVDASVLRTAFNQGQFYERLSVGQLYARVHPNSIHLSRRLARARGEPRCTRSQMVSYYELSGLKVAVVHLYRRRDGTIGASGRPDPKWLRVHDRILWTTD